MCNSSIVKHYYDYHYKLTKIINKIDKPATKDTQNQT